MIEVRISDYQWRDLDPVAQTKIKQLARDYAQDYGYDFEFNYYWIKFTEENYFLSKLRDFDTQQLLKVADNV